MDMEQKLAVKQARKGMNRIGLILLIYYGIMNLFAILAIFADMVVYLVRLLAQGMTLDVDALVNYVMERALTNGWGYILSILAGTAILLLWKGWGFVRDDMFRRDKTMTVGSFFQILFVFFSAQFLSQLFALGLEWLLNRMGFSAMAAMEMASTTGGSFSMFLYACFLGPIAEELLFRGLILRLTRSWGKQTAILVSALAFGLFHGNIIQIPFAFSVGLVLGFVTVEYSIVWAIVLHVINNLILADLLGRVVELLPETAGLILSDGIVVVSAVVAVVVLIIRRREVAAYFRENKADRTAIRGLFTSPVVLIFGILMLLMSLLTITRL